MRSSTPCAAAALALAALCPDAATAFTVKARTAPGAACATSVADGPRRAFTAPVDGVISAGLRGERGADWDLGLVDAATRRVLNGSAGPHSRELADSRVEKGQRIVVQACRRSGRGRARIRVSFTRVDFDRRRDGYTTKVVRVSAVGAADRERLASLRLDATDHPGPSWQDVILHSAADEARLRAAGFDYDVRIADLLARSRANRLRDARSLKQASALPSGRTSYRTLPEIQQELKDLAAANPGFVRAFTLPLRSLEGRDIMGIEIAEGVQAPPDGRPVYVQMGTHHAREWPANEATLEYGIDLINAYRTGSDARMADIVRRARTYVIPVVNVDGFNATIEAEGLSPGGTLEDPTDSGGAAGEHSVGSGAYKRKTCSDWGDRPSEAISCLARTYQGGPLVDRGADPNRNYGVEFGGPGSASTQLDLTYHGPHPFSEVETESMRRFLRDLQPTIVITNHTYTGLILRPPGTQSQAPVPDEDGLRAIGDAMAAETGYLSQFSYQLYDTSGTTDDYVYGALGGFSYTPEIGKDEFHPAFTTGFVPEYTGRAGGGGLREAFTLAGMAVVGAAGAPATGIDARLRGSAPAGRTLRLRKPVAYTTSALPDDDGVQFPHSTISEERNSTLVVGPGGTFDWSINPSSQPRGAATPWTLTCEDGAGNVLETRSVFAARGQVVHLGLNCGAGSAPLTPQTPGCALPYGFARVDARRWRRGLRFAFTRKPGAGRVTVTLTRASRGRRIVAPRRVARFAGRTASFRWRGRRSLRGGVFVARFSVRDAAGRADVRRVTVVRKRGRFARRGTFYLADTCR